MTLEEFVQEAVEKTGLDLMSSGDEFQSGATYEDRCKGFAAHVLSGWLFSRKLDLNMNPYPLTDIVELSEMILERRLDR